MIVVADLHRATQRVNEVYQVDKAFIVERKGMKVEQSYIDRTNNDSDVSGKMFVVDKAATAEWNKAYALDVEAKKLAADKAKLGITEQAEALIEKSKPKKTRRTKAQIEADEKAGE